MAPAHASTVTNEDLAVGQQDATTGICVTFDFILEPGMGDDPTANVILLLNEEDVSGSVNWVVADSVPPADGTGCYAPGEPLPSGIQDVRVRYSDSTGREYLYAWRFAIAE